MADDRYTRLRSISGRLRDLRNELETANEPHDPTLEGAASMISRAGAIVRRSAEQNRVITLGRED